MKHTVTVSELRDFLNNLPYKYAQSEITMDMVLDDEEETIVRGVLTDFEFTKSSSDVFLFGEETEHWTTKRIIKEEK